MGTYWCLYLGWPFESLIQMIPEFGSHCRLTTIPLQSKNIKPNQKKCTLSCQSCFCQPVFYIFAKHIKYFRLQINFLTINNYSELHHLQGGMKCATQISPLLNLDPHSCWFRINAFKCVYMQHSTTVFEWFIESKTKWLSHYID